MTHKQIFLENLSSKSTISKKWRAINPLDYANGGANSILDVLDNNTKVKCKENLNHKTTISKIRET